MSHWWCCCCPECTLPSSTCCACVCPALCVTFTPDDWDPYKAEQVEACETDTQKCRPQSVELDWDDEQQAYVGAIAGHDLIYSFYRNEYDGKCYFYLESYSLGRHEWEVIAEEGQCYGRTDECVRCLDLRTAVGVEEEPYEDCSAGTLTTECVNWITPITCATCACLCECLCVDLTMDGIAYSGKACWDEYQQAYVGDVSGLDTYGVCQTRTVRFPIDRWGDVCDPDAYPGEPTACEPIRVIDDAAAVPDFALTGTWTLVNTEGYRGSVRTAAAGTGAKKAEWRFTGLPAGSWRVAAIWTPGEDRATNATFTVLDGTRTVDSVSVDQQNAPDDFAYDGANWERLGTFRINGSTLTVRLTDDANGVVCADAIHLEYIDDRCGIGFEVSAEAGEAEEEYGWISGDWQRMTEPCQWREVNYSWSIQRNPYISEDDITASIRCAECNEVCRPLVRQCCPNGIPRTLYVTWTTAFGNPGDISFIDWNWATIPIHWVGERVWRGYIITKGPPSGNWTDTVKFWVSVSCDTDGDPASFGISWWTTDLRDNPIESGGLTSNMIEDCEQSCQENCWTQECLNARGYICCNPFFMCGYGAGWYLDYAVVTE